MTTAVVTGPAGHHRPILRMSVQSGPPWKANIPEDLHESRSLLTLWNINTHTHTHRLVVLPCSPPHRHGSPSERASPKTPLRLPPPHLMEGDGGRPHSFSPLRMPGRRTKRKTVVCTEWEQSASPCSGVETEGGKER